MLLTKIKLISTVCFAVLLFLINESKAADKTANISYKITKNNIIFYQGTANLPIGSTAIIEKYEDVTYTSNIYLVPFDKFYKTFSGKRTRSNMQEGYKLTFNGIKSIDNKLHVNIVLETKEIVSWKELNAGSQMGKLYQPEMHIEKIKAFLVLPFETPVASNKVFEHSGETIPYYMIEEMKKQPIEEIESGYAVEIILNNIVTD